MGIMHIMKLCVLGAFAATIVTGIIFMLRWSDEAPDGIHHPKDLSSGKDAKALGEEGFEVGKNAKNNEKTENGEVFSNPKMKSPIFPSTASKVPQEVTQTHQTTDAPTIEPAVMKELKEVKSSHSPSIQIFYYPWYGAPAWNNGSYFHWNHRYLPPPPQFSAESNKNGENDRHSPPNDLASSFYPSLGPYSSWDPAVIGKHWQWIASAGIDVVVVSWYPRGRADPEGSPWDALIPKLLDSAQTAKIKLTFHLEPYQGRTARSVRDDIKYIMESYGSHPAFYRAAKKTHEKQGDEGKGDEEKELPLFYIYDSYRTPAEDWAEIASPNGSETIRGTPVDALLIGLYLGEGDKQRILASSFDGLYTYFAAEGFTDGSIMANWPLLSTFCAKNRLLFVPSVGPGYNDTRVRPWNAKTARDRAAGEYYKDRFKMAHTAKADIVAITSFNEWHEGTQIEPAVPFTDRNGTGFHYLAYDRAPEQYLEITLEMVHKYFTPRHQNIPAQISRVV